MQRPLSAGVRQSVRFVNNGLQISPSAPVQKTTRSCTTTCTQLAPAHEERKERTTGGHIDGNIEWKCALFCGKQRLTREQFLLEFLKQTRVAIPDAMRAQLERELI